MLLFSVENQNFHFLNSPIFGFCPHKLHLNQTVLSWIYLSTGKSSVVAFVRIDTLIFLPSLNRCFSLQKAPTEQSLAFWKQRKTCHSLPCHFWGKYKVLYRRLDSFCCFVENGKTLVFLMMFSPKRVNWSLCKNSGMGRGCLCPTVAWDSLGPPA